MHSISVIIPVRNGEATLPQCLQSIRQQTVGNEVEIIILDSSSTDNSKSIAERFGATVINIEPSTFNHGGTRNLGAEIAKGDLLYFTVQDARLASADMLEKMTLHFADPDVQAVNGIQGVPSEKDKNPALWFKRYSEPIPEIRQFPNGKFNLLSNKEQLKYCNWDNVNAMYRKDILQKIKFREINFSEDSLWANDALKSGYKIIRDSALLVFHYHHLSFKYIFRTSFIINYYFLHLYSITPSFPKLVKPFFLRTNTLIKRNELRFIQKLYWICHNAESLFGHWLSVLIFKISWLIGGNNGIDTMYKIICKTVPQGRQK